MERTSQRHACRILFSVFALGISWAISCPPNAFAAEAPPCNDEDVLYKVRRAYEFAFSTDKSDHKFRGEAVKETGYGGPNAWVNKHAPSKDYYHKSRYCEATMRLDNGQILSA